MKVAESILKINYQVICNISIASILAFVTGYYGIKSWSKYRDDIVALSRKRVPFQSVNFPDITFCSAITNTKATFIDVLLENPNQNYKNASGMFFPREDILEAFENNVVSKKEQWQQFVDIIGGMCYTFSPSMRSRGHEKDLIVMRFYFPSNHLCSQDDGADSNECSFYSRIYFHDRGSFLYRSASFMGITYEYGTQNRMSFADITKQVKASLNKKEDSCDENASYQGWIKRTKDQLDKMRGCAYPWQDKIPPGTIVCNVSNFLETMRKDENMDVNAVYMNVKYIYNETGILKPCTYTEYSVVKSKYSHRIEPIKNKSAVAEWVIYYSNSYVEHIKEYWAFDFFNLVAELGGLCGLFLGFSFFPMIKNGISSLALAKRK